MSAIYLCAIYVELYRILSHFFGIRFNSCPVMFKHVICFAGSIDGLLVL